MQLKHANIGTIMYVVIYTLAVISALATPLTANIFESGPMPTPKLRAAIGLRTAFGIFFIT